MYALQVYAASREKSITSLIEDWIDSFKDNVHSSSTNKTDFALLNLVSWSIRHSPKFILALT
jgi:hypothetical protein